MAPLVAPSSIKMLATEKSMGWCPRQALLDLPVAVHHLENDACFVGEAPMVVLGPLQDAVRDDGAAHVFQPVADRCSEFRGAGLGLLESDGQHLLEYDQRVVGVTRELVARAWSVGLLVLLHEVDGELLR